MHRRIEGRQLMSDKRQSWAAGHSYAFLHFKTDQPIVDVVSALREIASGNSMHLHFASQRAATVAVQSGGNPIREMPFVTENVVIIQASHTSEISELAEDEKFQRLTRSFQSFYAAIVDRIL
jgi:hypothetical protein